MRGIRIKRAYSEINVTVIEENTHLSLFRRGRAFDGPLLTKVGCRLGQRPGRFVEKTVYLDGIGYKNRLNLSRAGALWRRLSGPRRRRLLGVIRRWKLLCLSDGSEQSNAEHNNQTRPEAFESLIETPLASRHSCLSEGNAILRTGFPPTFCSGK